jgi:pyruvate dehydrogenase E1 component beta subunit
MPKLNMVSALNLALDKEMEKDARVVVLGEDVGRNGGVFRVTEGLWSKYSDERVVDTPLAESAIIGASIGLACAGFVPVPEIQFDGFFPPAFDQMINHAGRIRWRSRGAFSVPMTVRVPYGGGIKALEHHSESPEAHMVHTPGVKVVVPATPYEAKGLLASAIRDPDPVVFFEPKRVYRAIKEDVPDEDYAIPLGKARIAKQGSQVTVIAWGAMVREALEAADKTGIDIEIIDLRTLSPMDDATIIRSVKKTGRCVVVHEAARTCGVGAEIVSRIQEKAFLHLEAPVKRVTGWDTVVPLAKLEPYYIPDEERIAKAVEEVARF